MELPTNVSEKNTTAALHTTKKSPSPKLTTAVQWIRPGRGEVGMEVPGISWCSSWENVIGVSFPSGVASKHMLCRCSFDEGTRSNRNNPPLVDRSLRPHGH